MKLINIGHFSTFFVQQTSFIKTFGTIQFQIVSLEVVVEVSHFQIIARFTKSGCQNLQETFFDCLDDFYTYFPK